MLPGPPSSPSSLQQHSSPITFWLRHAMTGCMDSGGERRGGPTRVAANRAGHDVGRDAEQWYVEQLGDGAKNGQAHPDRGELRRTCIASPLLAPCTTHDEAMCWGLLIAGSWSHRSGQCRLYLLGMPRGLQPGSPAPVYRQHVMPQSMYMRELCHKWMRSTPAVPARRLRSPHCPPQVRFPGGQRPCCHGCLALQVHPPLLALFASPCSKSSCTEDTSDEPSYFGLTLGTLHFEWAVARHGSGHTSRQEA